MNSFFFSCYHHFPRPLFDVLLSEVLHKKCSVNPHNPKPSICAQAPKIVLISWNPPIRALFTLIRCCYCLVFLSREIYIFILHTACSQFFPVKFVRLQTGTIFFVLVFNIHNIYLRPLMKFCFLGLYKDIFKLPPEPLLQKSSRTLVLTK